MGSQTLAPFFHPASIAVIGASVHPQRAGYRVMKNLLAAQFAGPILPVSIKYSAVQGVLAYKSIDALPLIPALAVICTHQSRLMAILNALASKGCNTAIIIATEGEASVADTIYQLADTLQIRLLGMGSLGIINPHNHLNASLAHCHALPGSIAFVSQSAAVCTTVLDWANSKQIGFSAFISLGSGRNIHFADLLDHLARDSKTQSILLYVDSIHNARQFLSAARAVALHKPVLVIKSACSVLGAKAAALHNKGLFGHDSVYDAAIKRVGMLRVHDLHELFTAVETLAYANQLRGERLAIITNGGGLGIMAVDHLVRKGGQLATFDVALLEKLAQSLPNGWSKNNPIDILGDADPMRYASTLSLLLDSGQADAILIMHAPSALSDSENSALAVIDVIKKHPNAQRVNILTNWTGEAAAMAARHRFNTAKMPTFRTPKGAISAFMHLVQYRRNRKLLLETPAALPEHCVYDTPFAHRYIGEQLSLAGGHVKLDTYLALPLLAAYQLNTTATEIVSNEKDAMVQATQLGFPLALKINSPDIEQKAQVQGVMLNINNTQQLSLGLSALKERVLVQRPNAQVTGFTLQKMVTSNLGIELRVMIKQDPTFGPVIAVSQESDARDLQTTLDNAVVGLPPLNMALARYLILQGIADKKINIKKNGQSQHMEALCLLLTRLSQLLVDNPEISDLELNPVLIVADHITILDSQIHLVHCAKDNARQLAISPYPKQLEERVLLNNGVSVLLRPIRAEDEGRHQHFDAALTEEDRYQRYFSPRAKMSHEEMALLTQIDYAREMAFIAVYTDVNQQQETLAVIRASIDADNRVAEFALVVRSDYQGVGLGKLLLAKLIRYQKSQGTAYLTGMTMLSNIAMANLAKSLSFNLKRDIDEGVVYLSLRL